MNPLTTQPYHHVIVAHAAHTGGTSVLTIVIVTAFVALVINLAIFAIWKS